MKAFGIFSTMLKLRSAIFRDAVPGRRSKLLLDVELYLFSMVLTELPVLNSIASSDRTICGVLRTRMSAIIATLKLYCGFTICLVHSLQKVLPQHPRLGLATTVVAVVSSGSSQSMAMIPRNLCILSHPQQNTVIALD